MVIYIHTQEAGSGEAVITEVLKVKDDDLCYNDNIGGKGNYIFIYTIAG